MPNEMAGEIWLAKQTNREEIRRLTSRDLVIGIDNEEKWTKWFDEIELRINWQAHLEFQMDHAYIDDWHFEPDDVRLTLEDYKNGKDREMFYEAEKGGTDD